MKTIVKFLRNMLVKSPKIHHLGRWNLDNKSYLKTDYANMDSCGDILCGRPDHFKKMKVSTPTPKE